MALRRSEHFQPDYAYGQYPSRELADSSRRYDGVRELMAERANQGRSPNYLDATNSPYGSFHSPTSSATYNVSAISTTINPVQVFPTSTTGVIRSDSIYSNGYIGSSSAMYASAAPGLASHEIQGSVWKPQGRTSPEALSAEFISSASPTDFVVESPGKSYTKSRGDTGSHPQQRRPSNRDEFDGPHQFLKRPPPELIAQQERDLPHLPTNLVVHEQDSILTTVNDCLSQCAFDFVAKYQFPIPLANGELRPVERPQDREWTEWVYLLKRLATKRRIPARVIYNGQIKQFITILENSLEMRHAAKHQSRPLKDDRNILQLISAGIQVAKLLRDAEAMSSLDKLYQDTERTIQYRVEKHSPKFGYMAS